MAPGRGSRPLRVHTDERRTAYIDLFGEPKTDTNLFVVKPLQANGWHLHRNQDDVFVVLRGAMRFCWWREGGSPLYRTLTGPEDGMIYIPRDCWHGYVNPSDTDEAWLLMQLNQKYNPEDEFKRPLDDVPWLT
jgi:dTDP-4-dehydrorhamnose 3,5-epimerase-like enzyme